MNDKFKFPTTPTTPNITFDPVNIRAKQIKEEEEKRFNDIVNEVLDVLSNEKVIVSEIARVMAVLTNKINKKFDESPIENIIKLL